MLACVPTGHRVAPPAGGVDAAVVPGCPNEPDGRVSECQWRRAAWGAEMWRSGLARNLIASGAAAHTPYVEAETLRDAMVEMGVPADRVVLETQALHSDENIAFSMVVADHLGFRTLAVASDLGHSGGLCWMARRWGRDCVDLPFDRDADLPRIADLMALPRDVVGRPIPLSAWMAGHREPRMARTGGYGTSFGHYAKLAARSAFRRIPAPPLPPVPEPTLPP